MKRKEEETLHREERQIRQIGNYENMRLASTALIFFFLNNHANRTKSLDSGFLLQDEAAPLPVVCSLVLQPLPVALDTANLLTVVVRDGVGHRVGRRVHAESLYSVVELLLFL